MFRSTFTYLAILASLPLAANAATGGNSLDAAGTLPGAKLVAESPETDHAASPVRLAQTANKVQTRRGPRPVGKKKQSGHRAAAPPLVCEGGRILILTQKRRELCRCNANKTPERIGANRYRCTAAKKKVETRHGPRPVGKKKDTKPSASRAPTPQNGKTAGGGKRTGGKKAYPGCKPRLQATRMLGVAKGFVLSSAWEAWQYEARRRYGFHTGSQKNAKARSHKCKRRLGLLSCTVSARPCPPS